MRRLRRPVTAPLWVRDRRTTVSPAQRRGRIPPPKDRRIRRARGAAGREDRGSATAEIAVALPALVVVTAAALWGVTLASAQLACADAVRAGARAAARGESLSAVRAVVAGAIPAGATVAVRRDAELTQVEAIATVSAPGFTGLPPVTLRARAATATEPGAAG